jgi:ribonuclease BN (tRNA processing enzyme)
MSAGMELTVLGACGTYPSAGGACSGYLLRHEGFTLWMDAGHGTLAHLQRHVPLDAVDAVLVSHGHPDHFVDLYPFFYALLFGRRGRRRVPVYGPLSAHERIGRLLSDRDGRPDFDEVLPWQPLEPGGEAAVGPLVVRAFESRHSCPNICVRVEAGGAALCYTGDSGPHPALERAAAGADLFLCEASWLDGEVPVAEPIHLRAREAGEIAARAGARRLVLTHVWPENDPRLVREQAASAYSGPLEVAETDARLSL